MSKTEEEIQTEIVGQVVGGQLFQHERIKETK
jgi:hypothetical protein